MNKFYLSFVLLLSTNAFSECRLSNVCDDSGYNCRQQQLCDSAIDIPAINVPMPSIPSIEVKPLPSVDVPPIGTTHCEYMQVDGQWQNVCH